MASEPNAFLERAARWHDAISERVQRKMQGMETGVKSEVFVSAAIEYFEERTKREDLTWKSDQHFVNSVALKAKSYGLDELRDQKRKVHLEETVDAEGEVNHATITSISHQIAMRDDCDQTADIAGKCEERLLIEAALEAMTPDQRMAHMLLLKGYTPIEIAQQMNVSIASVYKLLKRGVEAARRSLKE